MQVKATISTGNISAIVDKKRKQIEAARTVTLRKIGEEQVQVTQERIRSSKKGPDGQAWAPWSMTTLKQRQRQGNASRGLLYRTGALLNSIKVKVEDGKLTIYSDAPYAPFLQFGTPKMPARPFIGWGNQLNSILNRIQKALK